MCAPNHMVAWVRCLHTKEDCDNSWRWTDWNSELHCTCHKPSMRLDVYGWIVAYLASALWSRVGFGISGIVSITDHFPVFEFLSLNTYPPGSDLSHCWYPNTPTSQLRVWELHSQVEAPIKTGRHEGLHFKLHFFCIFFTINAPLLSPMQTFGFHKA